MKKQYTKDDVKLVLMHKKRCSISSLRKNGYLSPQWTTICFSPIKLIVVKMWLVHGVGKREKKHLHTIGESVKLSNISGG